MSIDKQKIITPAQCRAGRALVQLTQKDLAQASSAGLKTVADFERGAARELHVITLKALRTALEAAGVEFIDQNGSGPGVRLKKRQSAK